MVNKRKLSAGFFAVILSCSLFGSIPAFAQGEVGVPNDVYTHWDTPGDKKVVYSRPMYQAKAAINSETLELETPMEKLTDICCDQEGNVYVLLGDESRLLVLEPDGTFQAELTIIGSDGAALDFTGARGIYADASGIYLADTENGRVVQLDKSGRMQKQLLIPESSLIPEGFLYRPMKVTRDRDGYLYVLSEGSYYGAILYSPEGAFSGFFGANRVTATLSTFLDEFFDRLFTTTEQKEGAVKVLPYQFVDLCTGADNYVYTVTGATALQETGVGQIKELAPNGVNILKKKTAAGASVDSNEFNFLEDDETKRFDKKRVQNLCSIAVTETGYMVGLDSTYGKIYVYDQACSLLTAFGGGTGRGEQTGSYKTPVSLEVSGEKLLVGDGEKNTITVYEPTAYGRLVMQAQSLTLDGDYEKAQPLWERCLQLDRNSRLAYRGMAKAAYIRGEYADAVRYAKLGNDKVTYDQAFEYVRQNFIDKNFVWLFPAGLLLLAGLATLLVLTAKRQRVLIQNAKVRAMLHSTLHPFRSFADVRYKEQGSVWLAFLLMALFYVVSVLASAFGGFLFSKYDADSFNSLYVLAQTVGVVLLWSVANWAVCTLFEGKGRFKDVLTVAAYSSIPLIVERILFLALSQMLSFDDRMILEMIYMVAVILTAWVLIVGTMVIHEFNFFKFVGTALLTLFGMLLIVFFLFMLGILLQQFADFLSSLFTEVIYR